MSQSSTSPRWVLPATLVVSLITVGVASLWPVGESTPTKVKSKAATAENLVVEAPHSAPAGMVWVPGGQFEMGTNELPLPDQPNPYRIKPDEFPQHTVELDGFWMDETEVTNRQFAEFVAMTGYQTFAEKVPTREELARSGMDISLFKDEHLIAGSLCFNPDFDRSKLDMSCDGWEYGVWKFVPGANWQHPGGPETNIDGKLDYPVVHVSWEDAVAYLDWAGKRLPTEAEFEYAARNGGQPVRYPWGNELTPGGEYLCNYLQGQFPLELKTLDGFEGASPVRKFPPNQLGLYDISGNLWEWCHDYFDSRYYANSPRRNPQGPDRSFDPQEPAIIKRVMRGGSFMCNTNSCTGYRCEARMKGEFNSGTFHTGFRGVVDSRGYERWVERAKVIEEWQKSR
ncbi:MAG: formylglycine-generating enzyme family protein [Planctomycetaceae bacterium]